MGPAWSPRTPRREGPPEGKAPPAALGVGEPDHHPTVAPRAVLSAQGGGRAHPSSDHSPQASQGRSLGPGPCPLRQAGQPQGPFAVLCTGLSTGPPTARHSQHLPPPPATEPTLRSSPAVTPHGGAIGDNEARGGQRGDFAPGTLPSRTCPAQPRTPGQARRVRARKPGSSTSGREGQPGTKAMNEGPGDQLLCLMPPGRARAGGL